MKEKEKKRLILSFKVTTLLMIILIIENTLELITLLIMRPAQLVGKMIAYTLVRMVFIYAVLKNYEDRKEKEKRRNNEK